MKGGLRMQNFNSLRATSLIRATNSASSKFVRSVAKSLSLPINTGMGNALKFQKTRTAQQAIANDWKKIGKDMELGVIKYDRQLTRQKAIKSK